MTANARRVLLAVTGALYETELLATLENARGGLVVARRCLDLADLLAAAAAGLAPVAVVDAALRRLDAVAVARLTAAGVTTVGVVPPGSWDDGAAAVLARWGVRWVVPADIDSDDLVRVVDESAADAHDPLALRGFSTPWFVGPGSSPAAASLVPQAEAAPGSDGLLVAVWGPTGAPGRTTVALAVADELAQSGVEVLLVDADTYGPSVAQRLALLDEGSGLAVVARAATAGTLSAAGLAESARELRPGMRVLTGVSRPERWPELSAQALDRVWDAARTLADWTVVDCGFCVEHDEELAYDTMAPRRNAATTSTLAAADLVLLVGSADPVGTTRLLHLLADVRALAPRAWLRVVLTQVRTGPVGRHPESQLTELLARHGAPPSPVLVPDDRAAHDAALASGRSLREVAPRSPARLALASLAGALVAELAPARSAQRALGR